MALFRHSTGLLLQSQRIKQLTLPNAMLISIGMISLLSLSACQTMPTSSVATPASTPKTATQTYIIDDDDYVNENDADRQPSEPYIIPKISPSTVPAPVIKPHTVITPSYNEQKLPVPVTAPPSHNELLERARQNSQPQAQSAPSNNNNVNVPAFQKLMQSGMNQLKSGQLNAAESSFTRAQRLAPKSPAVYFYLSQVALKKNQPRKAEAMARRGLSVSTDKSGRHALWQLILRSAQMQNNARVIKEAQQALR